MSRERNRQKQDTASRSPVLGTSMKERDAARGGTFPLEIRLERSSLAHQILTEFGAKETWVTSKGPVCRQLDCNHHKAEISRRSGQPELSSGLSLGTRNDRRPSEDLTLRDLKDRQREQGVD